MARRLLLPAAMKNLTLLLALVFAPVLAAQAQETDVPDGAVIESVEVLGIPIDQLSPALRYAIEALTETPLSHDRLADLASRIEIERPESIAGARTVARPEGKVRVVFVVAPIDEDPALSSNINARYLVGRVSISGVADSRLPQALRDDMQALVGQRLDPAQVERLRARMAEALPGYGVHRRVSRGERAGHIDIVFEADLVPWIPFAPAKTKLLYHSDIGWTYVQDVPIGGNFQRFTLGAVFNDKDDLVEEYRGARVRYETRKIVTPRFGASVEYSEYHQIWHDATLAALALDPIRETYQNRRTIEPAVSFALTPHLHVSGGFSGSELGSLSRTPGSLRANVVVGAVGFNQAWKLESGGTQRFDADFQVRDATDAVGSDFVYTRQFVQGRYLYRGGHSTIIASAAFGHISGAAPMFERFTLGDSSTLRGWSKYELAPSGADRMVHQSVEYRYRFLAMFLDTGSVWQQGQSSTFRASTGFGVHVDSFFATVAFPLNAEKVDATFMIGLRMGVKF